MILLVVLAVFWRLLAMLTSQLMPVLLSWPISTAIEAIPEGLWALCCMAALVNRNDKHLWACLVVSTTTLKVLPPEAIKGCMWASQALMALAALLWVLQHLSDTAALWQQDNVVEEPYSPVCKPSPYHTHPTSRQVDNVVECGTSSSPTRPPPSPTSCTTPAACRYYKDLCGATHLVTECDHECDPGHIKAGWGGLIHTTKAKEPLSLDPKLRCDPFDVNSATSGACAALRMCGDAGHAYCVKGMQENAAIIQALSGEASPTPAMKVWCNRRFSYAQEGEVTASLLTSAAFNYTAPDGYCSDSDEGDGNGKEHKLSGQFNGKGAAGVCYSYVAPTGWTDSEGDETSEEEEEKVKEQPKHVQTWKIALTPEASSSSSSSAFSCIGSSTRIPSSSLTDDSSILAFDDLLRTSSCCCGSSVASNDVTDTPHNLSEQEEGEEEQEEGEEEVITETTSVVDADSDTQQVDERTTFIITTSSNTKPAFGRIPAIIVTTPAPAKPTQVVAPKTFSTHPKQAPASAVAVKQPVMRVAVKTSHKLAAVSSRTSPAGMTYEIAFGSRVLVPAVSTRHIKSESKAASSPAPSSSSGSTRTSSRCIAISHSGSSPVHSSNGVVRVGPAVAASTPHSGIGDIKPRWR